MTLIRDFKQNWKPSLKGATIHVRLVIKEYSQLDKLVFEKQLEVTKRGLVVSGFTPHKANKIIEECLNEHHRQ